MLWQCSTAQIIKAAAAPGHRPGSSRCRHTVDKCMGASYNPPHKLLIGPTSKPAGHKQGTFGVQLSFAAACRLRRPHSGTRSNQPAGSARHSRQPALGVHQFAARRLPMLGPNARTARRNARPDAHITRPAPGNPLGCMQLSTHCCTPSTTHRKTRSCTAQLSSTNETQCGAWPGCECRAQVAASLHNSNRTDGVARNTTPPGGCARSAGTPVAVSADKSCHSLAAPTPSQAKHKLVNTHELWHTASAAGRALHVHSSSHCLQAKEATSLQPRTKPLPDICHRGS